MSNLFIPSKIRVGFQKREDTFTGKLAYIIYYDEKGKIRKEVSWSGWRDEKIDVLELDNLPRNNYVFNKGVKRDGHWGSGRSVIRVHDPRDFEFEISVDNLIGLLMHSDVSKRDIVEECVFAWSAKELVLLPVNSEEYQRSIVYTEKQSQKVSTKSLVPGHVYSQKKQEGNLTYIGFFMWYEWKPEYSDSVHWLNTDHQVAKGKKHIFHNGEDFVVPSVSTLAAEFLAEPSAEYAGLVEKFFTSIRSKRAIDIVQGSEKIAIKAHQWNNSQCINAYKTVSATEFVQISVYVNHNSAGVSLKDISMNYFTIYPSKSDTDSVKVRNTRKSGKSYRGDTDSGYYWDRHKEIESHTPEYTALIAYLESDNCDPSHPIAHVTIVEMLNNCGYNDLLFLNDDNTYSNYRD